MKPKYKVIVLITTAVLTMAVLIYVNLQNVRPEPRQQRSELNLTVRVGS
ncbi:hypothetical protein OHB35_14360 [Streptomyces phaeochromogenes]|uniref:Uncharacterized protein n=1 Tax=Streptomyces phaeochromogenes TaxID=1923 RepID=A0ABZ1H709_STRPH|nr:hypothetical protein [Streptomyces phaeochromogenes]WSD14332.1 hypothetical protein OHB35_14360 [Streptomyces phaeochromogenes]